MKIAATIIGTDDKSFRRVAANNERIALAKRIATATQNKADLVLLPAGFLAAGNANEIEDHARKLAAIFPHCGLLAGIDLERGPRDKSRGMPARAAPQTTPAKTP
jgi:hypothetical protein